MRKLAAKQHTRFVISIRSCFDTIRILLIVSSTQVAAAKCIYLNAVKNLYPQWLEEAKLRLEAKSHR
jgi:hypothetical protein